MTRNPVSVNSEATLREVAEILTENNFHALPVLEGDKIVGIISTSDLIQYLMENVEVSN